MPQKLKCDREGKRKVLDLLKEGCGVMSIKTMNPYNRNNDQEETRYFLQVPGKEMCEISPKLRAWMIDNRMIFKLERKVY